MKIVKINLSTKVISEQIIDKDLIGKWIGGRGLAAYLYSKDVRPADDPSNSVYIMTGAVTGTLLPSSSRTEVVSSSPLTGFYMASSAGGLFGAYLRSNGIMGLQIIGQSKEWVTLEIENGKIEIKDARELVGLNSYDLLEKVKTDPKTSVAFIGRAGENLVRFACLQMDHRAAGRGGTGWHFGFKKLKAIVVRADKLPVGGVDNEEVKSLVKEFTEKRLKYEKDGDVSSYCTPQYTDYASRNKVFPASNYRRNTLTEEELQKIGYTAFMEKVVDKKACWACPLGCTRYTKSKYSDQKVKGPEYETVWSLGASPDNFDMDALIEATRLCEDYGMDTISTGAILAWYKECCETGLVKEQWGPKRLFELIKLIGERKQIGNILAEGSVKASKEIPNSQALLAHSKGMELPAWDPRGAWGMAICYATGPTGGDHCKGWTVGDDLADGEAQFSNYEGKVKRAIEKQNFSALIDSSGFCSFADFLLDWEAFARCFNAVWGTSLSGENVKKISTNIFDLEKEINIKLGHSLEENTLPERIVGYNFKDGSKGLSSEDLSIMMTEYYKNRGWK